ncbi:MAG: glycosyltransferase [Clostridia bacterium]|nr:glycosyltransferase [Clostridia bacterium]
MNVLYLINYAGNGGSEKYVYNLINAYNDKKCDCYFAYNESGALAEQMAKDKIITFKIDMKSPLDIEAAKSLARVCRQNYIDIVHTHYPRENAIANLAKLYCKGLKVVYTNHFLTESPPLWKIINKLICSKTDAIIAVCEASRKLLIKNGYHAKKINVIYNGAKRQQQDFESTLRQELGIGKDEFVISSLSRFSGEKRMDFAVDVAKLMKEKTDKKFVFVLVGDGDMLEAVKKKVTDYGLEQNVRCIGYRTDTANILKGSDAFINCSQTEAMSFAIVEALSFEKPCVVSAVGGNVEIVNKKTGCGICCDKDSPYEFADAFIKLMEDRELYEKCKVSAGKSFEKYFSLEKSLDKTFEIYKSVLKDKLRQ